MENSDRRVAKRVPAVFRVNYIHDGDYLISKSKDISVDGMFLFTDDPPEISETTTLSFAIDGLGRPVEVNANVIWVNRTKSTKDSGMAVQFINPPEDLKDSILKIINKVAVLPD